MHHSSSIFVQEDDKLKSGIFELLWINMLITMLFMSGYHYLLQQIKPSEMTKIEKKTVITKIQLIIQQSKSLCQTQHLFVRSLMCPYVCGSHFFVLLHKQLKMPHYHGALAKKDGPVEQGLFSCRNSICYLFKFVILFSHVLSCND